MNSSTNDSKENDSTAIFYRQIGSVSDCKLLQHDIDALYEWSKANKLHFNIEKCCTLSFTRNKNPITYTYKMNGSKLAVVDHVKDLGVTIDSKLSYRFHFEKIVSSAYKALGFILRESRNLRNVNTVITLYNALVRPKLEYGCILWHSQPNFFTDAVEKVQKKLLRYLYLKKYNRWPDYNLISSIQLCREFNINTLYNRRIISILFFGYKILNFLVNDSKLLSLIYFNVPPRNTRLRELLHIPVRRTTSYAPLVVMSRLINQVTYSHNVDIFHSKRIFLASLKNIFNVA